MFVTTEEIKKSVWKINNFLEDIETKNGWDYTITPTLEDIKYWEVVYFMPGSIGVYVAHDPYVEFYIIYHNLLGLYEMFYGIDASANCLEKLTRYGVDVERNTSWTNLHKMTSRPLQ